MLPLKDIVSYAVALFCLMSIFLLVQHEVALMRHGTPSSDPSLNLGKHDLSEIFRKNLVKRAAKAAMEDASKKAQVKQVKDTKAPPQKPPSTISFRKDNPHTTIHELGVDQLQHAKAIEAKKDLAGADAVDLEEKELEIDAEEQKEEAAQFPKERKGNLMCNGSAIDSEIIYWKIVPGDAEFESPITPHHDEHHEKYLTFEYDAGGWNNVRMGMECLLVVAHAMGRTLVVPPQQHLYLLGQNHQDKEDKEPHDEMGFEDFFDLELLRGHKGLHVMHMEEFLAKEAVTGRLKTGLLPPHNSSEAWGAGLWHYMKKVADVQPMWRGKYVAFPAQAGDFDFSHPLRSKHNQTLQQRMKAFGGDRSPVFYDQALQDAKVIHFPADPDYRLLQHHYAFAFFADPNMQSFYRRFVRDYMRYKDIIQCAGHTLVQAVREEARAVVPESNGVYYALHIRRGDFQFKDVKISAQEIVDNLHYPNGTAMIPPGSLVYISTDDPDGLCKGCLVNRQPCNTYATPKPPGCPEDTSWKAFVKAGWRIRFLRDFLRRGWLQGVNPNTHGMIESIVCSRAKLFAGTYFSTFTGYIHRLRGYHGLGEETYYHSKKYLMNLQMKKSVGHGFSREWRAGWTDDAGQPI